MRIKRINNKYNYKKNFKFQRVLPFILMFALAGCAKEEEIDTVLWEPIPTQETVNSSEEPISYVEETTVTLPELNDNLEVTLEEENIVQETSDVVEKETEVVEDTRKVVALTFDDGPGSHTDELLDILEENNVHATFFVVGTYVNKYPETLLKSYENGNEIAIHGYTHTSFTKLGKEGTEAEIEQVRSDLEAIGITPSNLVRPPYGSINDSIKELDYPFILWSVDTRDWESHNTDKIREELNAAISEGGIVLMHDCHATTVEAVKVLLPEFTDEYRFVTVSELFEIYDNELISGKTYGKVKVLKKEDN